MGRHRMVKDYMAEHVLPQHRKRFMLLMVEWDGRADAGISFYNTDVLDMKAKEAQEPICKIRRQL